MKRWSPPRSLSGRDEYLARPDAALLNSVRLYICPSNVLSGGGTTGMTMPSGDGTFYISYGANGTAFTDSGNMVLLGDFQNPAQVFLIGESDSPTTSW